MLKFTGKYTSCQVMTDEIEEEAISQIYGFLNHPAFEKAKIKVMPDVHSGKGAVIGFTSTLTDKVIPNVIGVDISCAVLAVELGDIEIDFEKLDAFIRKYIPSGCTIRDKLPHRQVLDKSYSKVREMLRLPMLSGECLEQIEDLARKTNQDPTYVVHSLGTLGGGNHFEEVGENSDHVKYLIIHSGSRNFGLKIAKFFQDIAKINHNYGDLSYLEGDDVASYFEAMKVAQMFAAWNRQIIATLIADHLNVKPKTYIESIHNYIDFTRGIIRKGAIAAEKDQLVVIPWNMRDGCIIGKGKGNPDWNYSAPHGAGRKMSRSAAKKNLSLDDFKSTMKGIWTSCVDAGTLDESPMAYKDHNIIEQSLQETVEIITKVKPLYNFKSSEKPRRKEKHD